MRGVTQTGGTPISRAGDEHEMGARGLRQDPSHNKTVFLGMSGGVDSSLSAVLLKEQGYKVVGVYMKNWSRDLPGMKCPWAEDLADAKRVAVKLGIDFRVFDFETEYKQKVVDYMLAEFKKGRTPNPDIMCNQEVKFKLFYEVAREQGADLIATGHYARTARGDASRDPAARSHFATRVDGRCEAAGPRSCLMRAVDENKDQTYFLYRISEEALAHTIFPVGGMTKPEVKKLATEKGLANAYKKESMGVCFVGEVGMKDFLQEYFPKTPGDIIDADTGKKVGTHEGAVFYTIGQRNGLNLGGGLPYYVVRKDMERNILYVSRNLNTRDLWITELELEDVIIRKGVTQTGGTPTEARTQEHAVGARGLWQDPLAIMVRLRHRAPLIPATFDGEKLIFDKPIKRPASGQSAVFYSGDICLGGGIIK